MRLIKKILLLLVSLGGLIFFSFKIIFYFFVYNNAQNNTNGFLKEALLESKVSFLKEKEAEAETLKKGEECTNSYLPLIPGASWNYAIENKEAKNEERDKNKTLFLYIPDTNVRGQGLKIESTLNNNEWTFVSELNCDNEGLTVDNLNLFLPIAKKSVTTTPLSREGFFLPKDLNGRSVWEYELITKNEDNSNNQTRLFEEKIKINFKLVATTKIESLAGRVEAKKIEARWEIERVLLGENSDAGPNLTEVNKKTALHYIWLTDGIGIIKSVYQEEGDPPTTLILRGFQIPNIN